jgi:hypothetical protein
LRQRDDHQQRASRNERERRLRPDEPLGKHLVWQPRLQLRVVRLLLHRAVRLLHHRAVRRQRRF